MSHVDSSALKDSECEREVFAAARSEILKRIELRDRMLVASFSISMAILGGTMVSKDPTVGLLVPGFSLGASLVVCQHTMTIHAICCWTRREISFLHWGRSRELEGLHSEALKSRAVAQSAIFLIPALVAIAYGYGAAFARTSVLLSGLWWAGMLIVLAIAFVQWRTLVAVLKLNRETGYADARRGGPKAGAREQGRLEGVLSAQPTIVPP